MSLSARTHCTVIKRIFELCILQGQKEDTFITLEANFRNFKVFSNRAERQIGRRSSEKKLWGCETRRMFKKVQNCRLDQTTVVC